MRSFLFSYLHSSFIATATTATSMCSVMQVWVQSLFLFALVWSVGANTDEEGRTTFDHMLRKLLINDPPANLKPYIKVSLTVTSSLGYRYTIAVRTVICNGTFVGEPLSFCVHQPFRHLNSTYGCIKVCINVSQVAVLQYLQKPTVIASMNFEISCD